MGVVTVEEEVLATKVTTAMAVGRLAAAIRAKPVMAVGVAQVATVGEMSLAAAQAVRAGTAAMVE